MLRNPEPNILIMATAVRTTMQSNGQSHIRRTILKKQAMNTQHEPATNLVDIATAERAMIQSNG